jgi:hypothetical protein
MRKRMLFAVATMLLSSGTAGRQIRRANKDRIHRRPESVEEANQLDGRGERRWTDAGGRQRQQDLQSDQSRFPEGKRRAAGTRECAREQRQHTDLGVVGEGAGRTYGREQGRRRVPALSSPFKIWALHCVSPENWDPWAAPRCG